MGAGLAAVFILLLLIGGLSVFVLQFTATDINRRIKRKVVDEIQAYDVLIQKKEEDLEALRAKLAEQQQHLGHEHFTPKRHSERTNKIYSPHRADYVNKALTNDYAKICRVFTVNNAAVEESVQKLESYRNEQSVKVFEGLADKLTFDNVYKISTLQSEDQERVLDEILSEDEKKILNLYRSDVTSFDCAGFYSWLQVQVKKLDPAIHVLTACEKSVVSAGKDKLVTVRQDGQMCEGFQVRTGNRLCDHGLRRIELIG